MSMQGRKRKLAVLLSASMLSSTVLAAGLERASLKFMLPRKKQKTILRRGLEQE